MLLLSFVGITCCYCRLLAPPAKARALWVTIVSISDELYDWVKHTNVISWLLMSHDSRDTQYIYQDNTTTTGYNKRYIRYLLMSHVQQKIHHMSSIVFLCPMYTAFYTTTKDPLLSSYVTCTTQATPSIVFLCHMNRYFFSCLHLKQKQEDTISKREKKWNHHETKDHIIMTSRHNSFYFISIMNGGTQADTTLNI